MEIFMWILFIIFCIIAAGAIILTIIAFIIAIKTDDVEGLVDEIMEVRYGIKRKNKNN